MNRYHYNILEKNMGHLWKPYYQQPHRFYHTEHHIYSMILAAEEHFVNLSSTQLLALMFHDAAYVPGSDQNEENSVTLMKSIMVSKNQKLIPDANIEQAAQCILSTQKHEPLCEEANLIIDLDLLEVAIQFDKNAKEIKEEFCMFSEQEFKNGRIAFLKNMLKKTQLFYTDQFKVYEDAARYNMKEALIELLY